MLSGREPPPLERNDVTVAAAGAPAPEPERPASGAGRQRLVGIACLLVTATGWAMNWPLVKLLLRDWPPLFARGLAGLIAALVLASIAASRGQTLSVPRAAWPRLALAAFTNVFAWMGFSTLCVLWVSISEGLLLVFSMPIWAILFAWAIRGVRPSVRSIAALVLGLAGLVVLLGHQGLSIGGGQALGAGLALAAAMCFALGAVLNSTPLPLAPMVSVAWQVGLGCVPMIGLGLAFEQPDVGALTATGFFCFAYMTVVSMGVCYVMWFAALRRLSPGLASTSMLLVPLIGVTSAALLLGEPFGLREGLAMALTLGGVMLALRRA